MKSCDKEGYGKRHGHPLIILLDGHTSRWSYKGLMTLIAAGIFPFFIGSHTSAWDQPNDCGINALYKAEYGKAVQVWRSAHPFMTYDRVAFNWCCNRAILQCKLKLASDLAAWTAKVKVLQALGADSELCQPKGKPGNCVTRQYERTGWWPLQRESTLWEKAILQFGVKANCTIDKSQPMTTELGKNVRIRQVVLEAFRQNFLSKAEDMKCEYDRRQTRRKTNVPNTVFGKGFCKEEDLAAVKENDARIEAKEEAKVVCQAYGRSMSGVCQEYVRSMSGV